jgi:hypothetical protein
MNPNKILERALEKLAKAQFEESDCILALPEVKAILDKIQQMEDAADDAWYERNTRD